VAVKLLLFFLAIGLLSLAAAAEEKSCAGISSPITFEKLASKLQECNVLKIEDLLPLLPPEFRSRYVLVYASRSLQGATPGSPRVVMFGLDAKFILAFSGDPELPGYELLETIQFDNHEKRFEFRSVSFPAEKKKSIGNQKPVLSELNPQPCKVCHRQDLRPNWDTYSAWPGVYGSHNDAMPAAEREQYQTFKEQKYMKFGRYRFFEDADKYPDQAWYYDYYTWTRHNLQFNLLLSLLNSQTIAKELKENSRLHPFRYALLAALTCDKDFQDSKIRAEYIPRKLTSSFPRSFQEISGEVIESVKASYSYRETRQCHLLESLGSRTGIAEWECTFKPKEIEPAESTSRFRYIMEMAGVPFPKEWSMEFGSKNYVFYAGEVGQVGELGLFLWRELLDPMFDREIYQIYLQAWEKRSALGNMVFSSGTEDVCRLLGEKSLQTLSSH
jgi:hypothetical protein